VTSLTLEDEDDRMDLRDALDRLEQIVKKYPVEALPPAQQPEVAKDCVFCLEKPRDVRFECGHCVVCTECLGVMRADARRCAMKAADESAHPHEREEARKKMVATCPTCREPIGERIAESGAELGTAPTFKMPARGEEAAPAPAVARAPVVARGGRSGRGGRGRGTGLVASPSRGGPSASQ